MIARSEINGYVSSSIFSGILILVMILTDDSFLVDFFFVTILDRQE